MTNLIRFCKTLKLRDWSWSGNSRLNTDQTLRLFVMSPLLEEVQTGWKFDSCLSKALTSADGAECSWISHNLVGKWWIDPTPDGRYYPEILTESDGKVGPCRGQQRWERVINQAEMQKHCKHYRLNRDSEMAYWQCCEEHLGAQCSTFTSFQQDASVPVKILSSGGFQSQKGKISSGSHLDGWKSLIRITEDIVKCITYTCTVSLKNIIISINYYSRW